MLKKPKDGAARIKRLLRVYRRPLLTKVVTVSFNCSNEMLEHIIKDLQADGFEYTDNVQPIFGMADSLNLVFHKIGYAKET